MRANRKLHAALILVFCISCLFHSYAFAANSDPDVFTTSPISDKELYRQLLSGQRATVPQHYAKPDEPTVYLTFDDGPSRNTEQILDILQEAGVKATFFALGKQAERYPEVIHRIIEEGHQLGNHTYDHVYKSLYGGGFEAFWEQVMRTEHIFDELAGVRPSLIRAPGGTHTNFDAYYFYMLEAAGFHIHDWNIDSGDSRRRSVPAEEIIANVGRGPFPHEVNVLMHDGAGHAQTVKALPDIIRIFKDKGYQFGVLTAETRPIQHSLGPLKWDRSYSFEQFAAMKQKANERWQTLEEGRARDEEAAGQTNVRDAVYDAGSVLAPEIRVLDPGRPLPAPLHLTSPQQQIVLEADQYFLHEDRFYISLRTWSAYTGGQIEWLPEERAAVVQNGAHEIRYEPGKQTVEKKRWGSTDPAQVHDMKMIVREDAIFVPLRLMFELFDLEIQHFTVTAEHREVSFKPQPNWWKLIA